MSSKRKLPSWMISSDQQSSKVETAKQNPTHKVEESRIKRMRYWMNEQELMETALEVLRKSDAADGCVMTTEKTVISETDEHSTDSDVSDDGVAVAEQETVPYVEHAECLERKYSNKGTKRFDEHLPASSQTLEDEVESRGNKTLNDSDDEALRAIREIFFS